MARNRVPKNTSRRHKSSQSQSPHWWIYLLALIILGVIGWMIYAITQSTDYQFKRADLDKYIQMTHSKNFLEDGASIYLDMSDGMNCAYAETSHQQILQAVINKLAANEAIKFYGLASGQITPILKSHTELYNYMMNSRSYSQQQAPIEQTLETIVSKRQPALLMTDFEEYKGGIVERAAYAKKYFIQWLAEGYNITFYKWDFVEHGLSKHMFLAVFDDNANRLNALVDNAVKRINPQIETYVLASREYAYPTGSHYISLKQGGNYHNSKGQDIVTAVIEDGGPESYKSYAQPFASASGAPGQFAPLDNLIGDYVEYYPLGVDWASAYLNSKQMQEKGIPAEDAYTHLLSNLYVNFKSQDGFSIDKVEVRLFDLQETMKAISSSDSIDLSTLESIPKPEINEVLSASLEYDKSDFGNWELINVDFDDQFNGTFSDKTLSTHLFRANIVISEAKPKLEPVDEFFGWEGNPSLVNSIKEALTASSSSPCGRIVFTYYLRSLSE